MMRIFKHAHFPITFLVLLYGATRLINLDLLPIFTDESIYIYWAKVIESSHAQWFISLTDGKPPLLVWMIAFFLTILPDTWYLIAGRLPAVIMGIVSVIAVYKLAELLIEDRRVAGVAGLLYILFPFTLLYDRMALFDSPLQATLLAATYFAIKTVKTLQVRCAILWGFCLGLAFLFKPTAILFLGLLPAAVFFIFVQKKKKNWKRIIGLTILAAVISEVINNLQRVSSVYFMAGIKNSQFQQPVEELLKNPFALTVGNMQGFFGWIIEYYTVPVLLIGIVGFIVLLRNKFTVGIVLLSLWFVPIVALATVGREIFPRYILFTTPYFLLAVAYIFVQLYNSAKKFSIVIIILGAVVLTPLLITDYHILTDPTKADLPQTDYDQLVATHPSGYGIDRVFQYVNIVVANGQPVTVVTQGTFGLYPYAFMLEYWDNPEVTVLPRWPLDTIDDQIISAQDTSRVIILLKEHESIPEELPLSLIEKVGKPGGMYPILVTELQ